MFSYFSVPQMSKNEMTAISAMGLFMVLQLGEIPANFPAAHSTMNHLEWDGI